MISAGWEERATELIHTADRCDEPIYLVDAAMCRDLFQLDQGVAGFTSRLLSLQLRPILNGTWEGPGFAAVVDPTRHHRTDDLVGTCLHEYCHHVLSRPDFDDVAAVQSLASCPQSHPPTSPELVVLKVPKAPPWTHHGPVFLRVVIHLAHRIRFRIPIGAADLVQEIYDLANVLAYQAALGEEPQRRYWEPLAAIAASDPPAGFREFAEWDLQRARRALDRTPP